MHTFYWVPHQMPMHYALIYKMNKNKTVLMTLESWRTVDIDKLHEEAPSERRSTCRSTADTSSPISSWRSDRRLFDGGD